MRRFRTSFLLVVMVAAALAQTASDLDSPAVNRVAAKLKCNCGCNQNMACVMPPGCPVCKTNKTKIFGMQKAGMDDRQILDQYVAENGKDIIVIPPGLGGFAGPYIALGLGLLVVLWTIRRYMPKSGLAAAGAAGAAPGVDADLMARIEKDTADLD
jgi:cytochrome c-type biogenesis protein CcmH/NrfF